MPHASALPLPLPLHVGRRASRFAPLPRGNQGRAMSRERPLDHGRMAGSAAVAREVRYPRALGIFYLGLMALLLLEQFVVRLPLRGYLDVAMLFAVANIVLAVQRARASVIVHGTLRSAVLGVLPVALAGTAVGGVIVAASDSEPTTVAVVAGSLAFLVVFVIATAGWQYLRHRRDQGRSRVR